MFLFLGEAWGMFPGRIFYVFNLLSKKQHGMSSNKSFCSMSFCSMWICYNMDEKKNHTWKYIPGQGHYLCRVSYSPHVCRVFLEMLQFPPTFQGCAHLVHWCVHMVAVWVGGCLWESESAPCHVTADCPGLVLTLCPELPGWTLATCDIKLE